MMMKFIVKGAFKKGNKMQEFSKEVEAPSKNAAIQKVSTGFGSIYKCKKNGIKIKSAEETK